MSLETVIQALLALALAVVAYWVKRTDCRVDAVEKGYVRRDDYHRDQDTDRERLQRMEVKLDRVLERVGGSK